VRRATTCAARYSAKKYAAYVSDVPETFDFSAMKTAAKPVAVTIPTRIR